MSEVCTAPQIAGVVLVAVITTHFVAVLDTHFVAVLTTHFVTVLNRCGYLH
jgi:hypothetical protein